ncbi:hypothetical protein FRC07_001694 [Ceratobasidium sp. 392]|nr:hypothetical protein FRC07_001694 [Ceratobasidium sp. 392]
MPDHDSRFPSGKRGYSNSYSPPGRQRDNTVGATNYIEVLSTSGLSGYALTSATAPTSRTPDPQSLVRESTSYQVDLLGLLETWKEKTRDLWFRRNGIDAPSTETRFDKLIPELHGADYAQQHFSAVISRGFTDAIAANEPRFIAINDSPPTCDSGVRNPLYVAHNSSNPAESVSQNGRSYNLNPQGLPYTTEDSRQPSYHAPITHSHESNKLSQAISISGKIEPAAQVLAVTTSDSGDPQSITLLRNKSPSSDWGETYRGIIRVQRPAGVKWNEPIRCAYISPITGSSCRTSVKRGPDLERHL